MNEIAHKPLNIAPSPLSRALRIAFWSLLIAGAATVWFCREPLRAFIFARGVMLNDAPTQEAMDEVLDGAKDRPAAIRKFWDSKKIVDREEAIRELSQFLSEAKPISAQLQSWIEAAALDPDMDVQEVAFAILREHKLPALDAICLAKLHDSDPEVRRLALDNLSQAGAQVGIPSVIPLLKDPDPRIIATALKLLENWTGQKFGVRLADTVPNENKETGLLNYSAESQAKAKAGAARAEIWWAGHQTQFRLEAPAKPLPSPDIVPAGNFSLSTLDGRPVRLADFRGKVVLINFWTTWCTACIGEMPELIELQKRHPEQFVILGVSLDCIPDEDDDTHGAERPSVNEIRHKVARAVKTRGINYTVLLDEKNRAGSRFNGGELPTTVIVDGAGNMRRRFIGARSLPVFEAMLTEAAQPLR